MHEFHLDTIGTHLRICIDSSSPIGEDFSLIENQLKAFEQKFSRFIPDNWLADLNISRHGILDIDGEIMLGTMLHLARKSDGYFDPTIGKRLRELGYANSAVPQYQGVVTTLENVSNDYRDIDLAGNHVTLKGDIELEFGGIGKGYMLGWIATFLSKYPRYLIDFGGDLYGAGAWKVGLENPFALDEVIGTYVLDRSFLACSSGVKRQWGNHHHLIDPHTGYSADQVLASYIEAMDGMIADGYATTLCVMPWDIACETLAKTPEIEGVLVSKHGDIFKSKGSKAELFS